MVAARPPRLLVTDRKTEDRMKAVIVTVLVVGVLACGVSPIGEEPTGGDPALDDPGVGRSVALSSSALGPHDWLLEGLVPHGLSGGAAVAVAPAPAATPQSATTCATVVYCDAPGPDGTRCVQKPGCNLNDAADQCASEAPRECFRVVCPWVLVGHDGRRLINGACL
jgi:hypothetical protein